MNAKEKMLAVHFLTEYKSELAQNCCNDIDKKLFSEWTIEERQQLVKEYHEWNGYPEEYDPDHLNLPDFCLVSLLAHKLNLEIKRD